MYLPEVFSENNEKHINSLIQKHPFATVLSFSEHNEGYPFINHLPIILDDRGMLIGHMSRNNPQWQHFINNSKGTFIFHGSDSYISSKWYQQNDGVPTWNYVVAHVYGKVEIIQDRAEKSDILSKMLITFEGSNSIRPSINHPLLNSIVCFQVNIEKKIGKFKLSQNRSKEDYLGVMKGLAQQTDDSSLEILKMMQEHF